MIRMGNALLMHEEHPPFGRQECKTSLTGAGHAREGGESRVGCRFGVPGLVLSRNRPPSSLAPGRTPVRTPGAAEGRGPGRRLPPSGDQQGPGSGVSPPRLALGRRPSAPHPRPRLVRPAGPPPTRPVAAAASPTTRGSSRTNAVCACATSLPAAPARPSPHSASARGAAPQTRRAGARGRRVRQLSGFACACAGGSSRRVTGAGCGNGRKALRTLAVPGGAVLARTCRSHGYRSLKGARAGRQQRTEAGSADASCKLECRSLTCHPLVDDLQIFMGTSSQVTYTFKMNHSADDLHSQKIALTKRLKLTPCALSCTERDTRQQYSYVICLLTRKQIQIKGPSANQVLSLFNVMKDDEKGTRRF
ncbi:uncharacterized protein LOC143434632 [Arvicanthis niloticus]|uniref:uncharacterized protein LOC143309058 n=1 Tax=Arvicanthis niloticus TaxID=61156 RepID=UPI00402B0D6E